MPVVRAKVRCLVRRFPCRRTFACALALAFSIVSIAAPPRAAAAPAGEDLRALREAVATARAGDWPLAYVVASQVAQPLALELAYWFLLTRSKGYAGTFAEVTGFVERHQHWPQAWTQRRRAEEAITASTPVADVLAWFERFAPVSAAGALHHARALRAAGRDREATALVRETWIAGAPPRVTKMRSQSTPSQRRWNTSRSPAGFQ
jgi:soluble lytic murein transglycosylase